MKILVIATILPVPGFINENQYVLNHIERHSNIHEFEILRPISFIPKFFWCMSKRAHLWESHQNAIRNGNFKVKEYYVAILPYLSIGSNETLHSIISASAFFFNINLIKKIIFNRPDIVHAHNIFPDGLIAYLIKRKYGIPYCLTLQDERRFFRKKVSKYLSGIIIKNANSVNTLSSLMRDAVEVNLNFPIDQISIGIDESFFFYHCDKTETSKTKFVTVSNLLPIKNIANVIRAFALLDTKDHIDYTIIGDGPEKDHLKALAIELGLDNEIIRFKSMIPNKELASHMINYDVFIQPSFKESFGLTYFEALACGLPVIITENTGAYSLIKNIDCYLLVNPTDPEDIRQKISIASDKHWIRSRRDKCLVAASFANWDNFLKSIELAYRNCVNEK